MTTNELRQGILTIIRANPRGYRLSGIHSLFPAEPLDRVEAQLWALMIRREVRLLPDSTFEAL